MARRASAALRRPLLSHYLVLGGRRSAAICFSAGDHGRWSAFAVGDSLLGGNSGRAFFALPAKDLTARLFLQTANISRKPLRSAELPVIMMPEDIHVRDQAPAPHALR